MGGSGSYQREIEVLKVKMGEELMNNDSVRRVKRRLQGKLSETCFNLNL